MTFEGTFNVIESAESGLEFKSFELPCPEI